MSENDTNHKIEDEILMLLDSELKETALGFAAYLDTNQMTPRLWFGGPGYWRIPWENKYLCGIVVNKDRLRFWFFKGDYSGEFDAACINTVHDHVRPCINCTTDCKFGIDTTVFGKDFENTCFQFPVQFENPDSGTLEAIKALIEYWKDVVPPDDAWHAH